MTLLRSGISRVLLSGFLVLGLAGSAQALSYTLAAPVPVVGLGVNGTLNPVQDLSGSILLFDPGAFPGFAGFDVFVVDLTLAAGSQAVDELGITIASPLFFLNPVGAGAFDDTGAGDIAPSAVEADTANFRALYTFAVPLAATETSVRLFTLHSPEGDILGGQSVSFMVSPNPGAGDFSVFGTTTNVPEPGILSFLGLGLLGLLARRHLLR